MILLLTLLGEVSLSGSNEMHLWLEQPGWKTQFCNEANADLYVDAFRVGGRFLLDAEKLRDTLTRIELTQRYLEYSGERFSLTLGNYYTTLGYGLALSSFEDKAMRIDRNLDGGKFSWQKNWLSLGALAGRMLKPDKENRDEWLYGADVSVTPLENLKIEGIYLRRDATTDADTLFGRAWEEWAEENVDFGFWRFNLGLASAQRFVWGRYSPKGWIGVDSVNGLGFFATLSYAQEGIGVLLEGKSYKGLAGGINAPPPANPDGESINEGADEQGFRANLNLAPWPWLFVDAGYALAWDSSRTSKVSRTGLDTRLDIAGHTFNPFFTLIDRELPGGGGSSTSPQNDQLEAGLGYETLIWEISAHFKGSWRIVTEAAEKWNEPHLLLELGWGPWMLAGGGVVVLSDSTEVWPWGSIRYNAYPFDLTLSYGRFKGEYICKNGICSYELPFNGLKADVTLYF